MERQRMGANAKSWISIHYQRRRVSVKWLFNGFYEFYCCKNNAVTFLHAPFFVVWRHIQNAQIQRKQITMKQENNINFFSHSFVHPFNSLKTISGILFIARCFYFAKFLLHRIWWRNISCTAMISFAESKKKKLISILCVQPKKNGTKKGKSKSQCHDTHYPK